MKELRQLAKDNGYDLDDLMSTAKKSGSKGKQLANYKDPVSEKTWSVKGPAPKWAKLYKEQGRMGELDHLDFIVIKHTTSSRCLALKRQSLWRTFGYHRSVMQPSSDVIGTGFLITVPDHGPIQ